MLLIHLNGDLTGIGHLGQEAEAAAQAPHGHTLEKELTHNGDGQRYR